MTIEYYDRNFDAFRNRTKDIPVEHLYSAFVAHVPAGGHILVAGCGPGRDTLAFLKRGYRVTAIDASQAMVELASNQTAQPALLLPFEQIDFENEFDGIWASASLLHVPRKQMDDVFRRLIRALKPGGAWYMSFKIGEGERINHDGRFFNDQTDDSFRQLLAGHPVLELIDLFHSPPINPQIEDRSWLHAVVRKVKA